MVSTVKHFPNHEREQSQEKPGILSSPFAFTCTVSIGLRASPPRSRLANVLLTSMYFIARLRGVVSTTKFSCSSPILQVSAVKGCRLHGRFVYFQLGVRVRAIGDMVNDDCHAVWQSFLLLIR